MPATRVASARVLSPTWLSTRPHFFADSPGPVPKATIPLNVPAVLAVAEKPGPLLDAEALAEPLEEPEDERDEEPLDFPDEPEPLLDPDPVPDADTEMPLPDPEDAAAGGRSLWTQTPSTSSVCWYPGCGWPRSWWVLPPDRLARPAPH